MIVFAVGMEYEGFGPVFSSKEKAIAYAMVENYDFVAEITVDSESLFPEYVWRA